MLPEGKLKRWKDYSDYDPEEGRWLYELIYVTRRFDDLGDKHRRFWGRAARRVLAKYRPIDANEGIQTAGGGVG